MRVYSSPIWQSATSDEVRLGTGQGDGPSRHAMAGLAMDPTSMHVHIRVDEDTKQRSVHAHMACLLV